MSASPRRARPTPDERPLLGDRYRLDGVLGRGGMATVHRAHDVLLERDVAVKVFPAVLHGTDDLLRNRAEIRVLATLSHPGLVTLHDAGTVHGDDGSEQVYLVMELVEGPTLAERLRDGALDVEQTARVGRDVAEALATVHEREIVHRDIKPANMLLTSADALDTTRRRGEPAVKLADFGIARLAGRDPADDDRHDARHDELPEPRAGHRRRAGTARATCTGSGWSCWSARPVDPRSPARWRRWRPHGWSRRPTCRSTSTPGSVTSCRA